MLLVILSYEESIDTIICGSILLAIFIVIYIYYSIGWHPFQSKKDRCPHCNKPLTFGGGKCKWCGGRLAKKPVVKKKKQEKNLFSFTKKNLCKECGTEMEYRENMDSWFCPTCRSYK